MAVQARLSPYLPKCHIVGNHMSWLICRLRPFLGVQNLLISIFLGFSCIHCICINESIPPHTHTHKHWAYMCVKVHQGLVLIAFAHARIQIFTIFVCLFHRGAHMLRSLTGFFFLTENYSTCINRPVRGPRMMRKSLL